MHLVILFLLTILAILTTCSSSSEPSRIISALMKQSFIVKVPSNAIDYLKIDFLSIFFKYSLKICIILLLPDTIPPIVYSYSHNRFKVLGPLSHNLEENSTMYEIPGVWHPSEGGKWSRCYVLTHPAFFVTFCISKRKPYIMIENDKF